MRTKSDVAVRKSITVEVDQKFAFEFFTQNITDWWSPDHHIGEADLARAVIEPKEGGRYYEIGVDGTECEWGRVLTYDPPSRLVLAWQINADWKYDPDFLTEVEVTFVAESSTRTRVELEHRNLERFGEKQLEIKAALDSSGGWTGLLESFKQKAEATSP
jgi:uncharacterized protein YndB with AHSA1/START domain